MPSVVKTQSSVGWRRTFSAGERAAHPQPLLPGPSHTPHTWLCPIQKLLTPHRHIVDYWNSYYHQFMPYLSGIGQMMISFTFITFSTPFLSQLFSYSVVLVTLGRLKFFLP